MNREKTVPIKEDDLYDGFGKFTRPVLKYWKDHIIDIGDQHTTLSTIEDINRRLLSQNIILFFDHHYAFDALPAALTLGRTIKNGVGGIIPYAAHLDMGLDREGLPSHRYRIRTRAFRWLVDNIQKGAPDIHFLPVVREFEKSSPSLKEVADSQFSDANTRYLKNLTKLLTRNRAGWACILAPMTGIAYPEKPVLDPQLYRSMEMVQKRYGQGLAFYFVGAYPRLHAHYHYLAPLLSKHIFMARGPFFLPNGDYQQAYQEVAGQLQEIRRAAQFTPPDYDRINQK